MNTTTNQTSVASSNTKRIILASAYRHERHTAGRQERALKTLRKMGHFDDGETLEGRRIHSNLSEDETLDE
jgi:hypothetical protein